MISINIKQRLSLGFTLLVLLAGLGCGTGWFLSSNSSTVTDQMINMDVSALKHAQNAQLALKTADEQTTAFLLQREMNHVESFNSQIDLTRKELDALAKSGSHANNLKLIQQALSDTNAFKQAFEQVVTLHQTRGLTHKDGLEGSLRNDVHEIEKEINAYQKDDMSVLMLMCRRHEKDYFLRGDPKYLNQIQERIQTFKILLIASDIPDEKKSLIRNLWANYYKGVSDIVQVDKQIAEALSHMKITQEHLAKTVSEIGHNTLASIDTRGNHVLSLLHWSQNLMLGVLVAAVGLGVLIATVITRWIIHPLKQLVARFKDISEGEGDLTQRVEFHQRKDEFGELARAFNTFLEDLRQLISDSRNTTDQLANAAHEIAASHEQMSQTASEQERNMLQVAAAIEQMSATAVQMTQQATDTTMCAGDARELALQGGHCVSQTVHGMQGICEAVNVTSQSISRLGEHSSQIGQIINVINDIADQTNLLALNAAIEAARAGQHGLGFAVVANEVRKLADRTTRATSEIADSIELIQNETHQAITQIQSGSQQVNHGVDLAQQAGESLKRIVDRASDVNREIQQISAGAREQAQTATAISRNVDSITQMAGQNNAAVSSAAQATTELSRQASTLQQSMSRFKI